MGVSEQITRVARLAVDADQIEEPRRPGWCRRPVGRHLSCRGLLPRPPPEGLSVLLGCMRWWPCGASPWIRATSLEMSVGPLTDCGDIILGAMVPKSVAENSCQPPVSAAGSLVHLPAFTMVDVSSPCIESPHLVSG